MEAALGAFFSSSSFLRPGRYRPSHNHSPLRLLLSASNNPTKAEKSALVLRSGPLGPTKSRPTDTSTVPDSLRAWRTAAPCVRHLHQSGWSIGFHVGMISPRSPAFSRLFLPCQTPFFRTGDRSLTSKLLIVGLCLAAWIARFFLFFGSAIVF